MANIKIERQPPVYNRKITTYNPQTFRQSYIQPVKELDIMLKADFEKFFLVRVEDLIRLIKLPVPPMRSTNHTFIFLTRGEATMKIGTEQYKIGKDECLFVPAGQVYSFDKHDKNKGYLCHFSDDFIVGKFGTTEILNDFEYLKVWGNPSVKLNKHTSKYVKQIFERILREYSENGLKSSNILQPNFISLLCEVSNAYKPRSAGKHKNSLTITNRFKELLFAHYKSKHRVSEYARLLNITPNHLNKVVRAASGKSPSRWIDEAIILEAKVLFHQSNYKVNEIANEVGILDQSYFTRLFKKYEGITPLEYRLINQKF